MLYTITPKHSNITDAKVDFAVNASNTRLILGSGVSMAFKNPTPETITDILNNIEAYLEWFIKQHQTSKVSLALPLLGCGVGGLEKEIVLQLYKEHFAKKLSYTCDVEVYGYSKEDFELIKQFF